MRSTRAIADPARCLPRGRGAGVHRFGDAPAAHAVWMVGVICMGLPLVFRTIRGAFARSFRDGRRRVALHHRRRRARPAARRSRHRVDADGRRSARGLRRRACLRRGQSARGGGAAHRAPASAAHRWMTCRSTQVRAGDMLVIRPGDVVPCDGIVIDGESELDTSSLTGEAMPVRATAGVAVMSGTINGARVVSRCASTAPAERSQYASIVELVRTAQASKAPLQRLADRYAIWFTPITVVVCAIAVAITHDWMRALAILVVATPCPLILATPVAIIGGINRAAKRFVIVRNGGAPRAAWPTWTRPSSTRPARSRWENRRCSASASRHRSIATRCYDTPPRSRIAPAISSRACSWTSPKRGQSIPSSTSPSKTPGQGIAGDVDGHGFVSEPAPSSCRRATTASACRRVRAAPALRCARTYPIDKRLAAVLEYADEVRPDFPILLASLARSGIRRFVLLSGDHAPIAREVAIAAGIRETYGDLLPGTKPDSSSAFRPTAAT